MQAALNRLIEKMWTENAIQDVRDNELGLERRQHYGHYSSYWTDTNTI